MAVITQHNMHLQITPTLTLSRKISAYKIFQTQKTENAHPYYNADIVVKGSVIRLIQEKVKILDSDKFQIKGAD